MDYSQRADIHLHTQNQIPPGTNGMSKLRTPTGYVPIPLEQDQQMGKLQKTDLTLKKNVRRFRLLSRVFTLLLSGYMTIVMAITLHKFISTRNIFIENRNPWAENTKIWPTALLLSTSAFTFLISTITVVSYFWGVSAANMTNDTVGTAGTVVEMAGHVAIWIGVSSAYRIGKDGNDLWGWTCSPKAQKIQGEFRDVINFERFCSIQSSSFGTSIAQAVLAIVTVVAYILAFSRMRHKGKLEAQAAEWRQATA
ncbi:hypothetical protein MMC06_004586 [Schaereria dolodes]|nr:hypothetical protein [Schaereria dolodes]